MSKKEVLTLTRLHNIKYYFGISFPSAIYLSESNLCKLIMYIQKGDNDNLVNNSLIYCDDSYDGGYILFNQVLKITDCCNSYLQRNFSLRSAKRKTHLFP